MSARDDYPLIWERSRSTHDRMCDEIDNLRHELANTSNVPGVETMADDLGLMLRDVLCAEDVSGAHLLPVELEDQVAPLVWRWEAWQRSRTGFPPATDPIDWREDAVSEGFDVQPFTRDDELAMLDILVELKLGQRWSFDEHAALKGEYLAVLGAVDAIRRGAK